MRAAAFTSDAQTRLAAVTRSGVRLGTERVLTAAPARAGGGAAMPGMCFEPPPPEPTWGRADDEE